MIHSSTVSQLTLIEVPVHRQEMSFARAVAEGLSGAQKSLPCRFFYDLDGSALFEQICDLPEYYLTRTEHRILTDYAHEIVAELGYPVALVEFGSGSSLKTRLLIDALLAQQGHLSYTPIDISSDFLRASSLALLDEYEALSIQAIAAEYSDALPVLPDLHQQPRLFIFLGSNIGNFAPSEAAAWLARVSQQMRAEDGWLIGFDLVKDPDIFFAAYNDQAGITHAFNKNLLARINRELGGDFALESFRHHAPFVEEAARIEMRLYSSQRQRVFIEALDSSFDFEMGEYIHTENCHKYSLASFQALCEGAGLVVQRQWFDSQQWFGMALLRKR